MNVRPPERALRETPMNTSPAHRILALSVALALPLALLSIAPASAATVGVTTWGDLKAAFLVDGDTVRLETNITAPANESLVVEVGENITLDLNGNTLQITRPRTDNAAIAVPPTSTLTITATGGGTLTATGGDYGAGIGGGSGGDGGTITINGGTITATGGIAGAGIGGGSSGGDGGTITVNGGTITANGGYGGAGIGGGSGGDGGTITINGGTITATGMDGAGIGGGFGGNGGTMTINRGSITATGGIGGAGIGGGFERNGGTITVNGGTTIVTGGIRGAGIGGGFFGNGGTTIVNGGTVIASSIASRNNEDGAGIGGGSRGSGGTTIINGGTVISTANGLGAGIGGGRYGNGGTTIINGGTTSIIANLGEEASGIGGGFEGNPGVLEVNGTPGAGAATSGGGPVASLVTNPSTPAGVGYFATITTLRAAVFLEVRFTYLVTFATNGGSPVDPQTISSGDRVTEPSAPSRDGYTFAGWTLQGLPYDFSASVTQPLVLAATWVEDDSGSAPPVGGPGLETDPSPEADQPRLADSGGQPATLISVGILLVLSGVMMVAPQRLRTARRASWLRPRP